MCVCVCVREGGLDCDLQYNIISIPLAAHTHTHTHHLPTSISTHTHYFSCIHLLHWPAVLHNTAAMPPVETRTTACICSITNMRKWLNLVENSKKYNFDARTLDGKPDIKECMLLCMILSINGFQWGHLCGFECLYFGCTVYYRLIIEAEVELPKLSKFMC